MNDSAPHPPAGKIETGYGTENPAVDAAFVIVTAALPPKRRDGRQLVICAANDIPEGGKRIVQDGQRSIGIFRITGNYYALLNVCPHRGAPLCAGHLGETHRPSEIQSYDPAFAGRILRCPWHGWEFDVVTGKGLHDRHGRAATFPVEINAEGELVVTV